MEKNKYIKSLSLLKILLLSSCAGENLNKYENLGKKEKNNEIKNQIKENERISDENEKIMNEKQQEITELLVDKLKKK